MIDGKPLVARYRASELQTPAQPGHFLQEFGQSDREISDNANRDASVTQALTLLNGTMELFFNKASPLMKNLPKPLILKKLRCCFSRF